MLRPTFIKFFLMGSQSIIRIFNLLCMSMDPNPGSIAFPLYRWMQFPFVFVPVPSFFVSVSTPVRLPRLSSLVYTLFLLAILIGTLGRYPQGAILQTKKTYVSSSFFTLPPLHIVDQALERLVKMVVYFDNAISKPALPRRWIFFSVF